ncbi:hypothetical protein JZ751_023415 [Albula glossodonta]|uniref:Uncharacterized protein n=1 Tax=Albula glossodonta TaxID=121402 RepID=A0A8T2NTS6_9TELE|nr:hypothetical protein JZ751_023415 [Albula glossodonta]
MRSAGFDITPFTQLLKHTALKALLPHSRARSQQCPPGIQTCDPAFSVPRHGEFVLCVTTQEEAQMRALMSASPPTTPPHPTPPPPITITPPQMSVPSIPP